MTSGSAARAAIVAGFLIGARDGEQEVEGIWIAPTAAPVPASCTWLRPIPEAPAAAAYVFEESAEAPDTPWEWDAGAASRREAAAIGENEVS